MSSARDQVSRLLALAPYLQARGGAPLSRVAADFGVPPQQILKDLQVLWMCGLPGFGPSDLIDIDLEAAEDDPDGLVRIANAEYLRRPFRLGSSEAAALIVALRALREGSAEGSRAVIDRTLAKLEEAASSGAHVEVHLPGSGPDLAHTRDVLADAIATDRQVRLTYYVPTRDETTERTADPIALLRQDGSEYLDAWCHQAEGRRLFKLTRVHGVEVLAERRSAPDLEPRDLSEGLFEPSPGDAHALVRLTPGLTWFVDYYPVTGVTQADDGSLEVGLRVADPLWLVRLALRLAPGLEVVGPAPIRTLTAVTAAATLSLYAPA